MPDTRVQEPSVEVGGGFCLEIGADEITVTADGSSGIRAVIAALAFCLAAIFTIAFSSDWVVRVVVTVLAGLLVWRLLTRPDRNLHCTRTSLDVVEVIRGNVRRTRSFPRAEVLKIRFGAVGYSRSGAIMGLVFTASSRKMKILAGLKAPEAQKILIVLGRFGYNVADDPGMQKIVERELNRRSGKSFF